MIVERIRINFLLLFAIACNTIPRWVPLGTIFGKKVYYVGQALSFVLIILAGRIKTVDDEVTKIFFDFTMWLAISNLMDELFFDPVSFGVNEIIFSTLVIIWTVYRVIKWITKTRSL